MMYLTQKGNAISTEAQIIVYYGVQRFSFGIRDFATPKAEDLDSKKPGRTRRFAPIAEYAVFYRGKPVLPLT